LRSSKKLQQQNDLMTLYQIGLQYKSTEPIVTIQEIIDVLNIPNKDVILKRLSSESQDKKVAMATQLVSTVMQIIQSKDSQLSQLPVEQLTLMIMEQMNAETLPTNNEKGI
jgi:SpoU rRNA methylase family enzyme